MVIGKHIVQLLDVTTVGNDRKANLVHKQKFSEDILDLPFSSSNPNTFC